MVSSPKLLFKNLKAQIADAIKESCYNFDARAYNIANEIHNIGTFNLEPGVDVLDGLTKIADKTVKESVAIGCDLSVIIKGIYLGAYRSTPYNILEDHHNTCTILKEILKPLSKYKGDVKQSVEGLIAAVVNIANEFKFNVQDALKSVKEDILSSITGLDLKFADEIKAALSSLDELL